MLKTRRTAKQLFTDNFFVFAAGVSVALVMIFVYVAHSLFPSQVAPAEK
jgi:hypothetical protein